MSRDTHADQSFVAALDAVRHQTSPRPSLTAQVGALQAQIDNMTAERDELRADRDNLLRCVRTMHDALESTGIALLVKAERAIRGEGV